jgi:hypothetical protein
VGVLVDGSLSLRGVKCGCCEPSEGGCLKACGNTLVTFGMLWSPSSGPPCPGGSLLGEYMSGSGAKSGVKGGCVWWRSEWDGEWEGELLPLLRGEWDVEQGSVGE